MSLTPGYELYTACKGVFFIPKPLVSLFREDDSPVTGCRQIYLQVRNASENIGDSQVKGFIDDERLDILDLRDLHQLPIEEVQQRIPVILIDEHLYDQIIAASDDRCEDYPAKLGEFLGLPARSRVFSLMPMMTIL